MYGEESVKLIRDIKRHQNTLSLYAIEPVRSIQREMRYLFRELMSIINSAGDNPSETMTPAAVAFITVAYAVIERNKQCLIVYHHIRMNKIQQCVWQMGAEGGGLKMAPNDIRMLMSTQEQEFYKSYSALVNSYRTPFSDVLDLTAPLTPPQSLWISVRATKELQFVTQEGHVIQMRDGDQHFVRQTDVQKFISMGLLEIIKTR